MSPAKTVVNKEKIEARRKKKEEEAYLKRLHKEWEKLLPEIPLEIKQTLRDSCEDGLMELLVMLESDPEAVPKLIAHAQYLLRGKQQTYQEELIKMEAQIKVRKAFGATIQNMQEVMKSIVLPPVPEPEPKEPGDLRSRARWTNRRVNGRMQKVQICKQCSELIEDCDCDGCEACGQEFDFCECEL